jgi:hypothetical protein
MTARGPHRSVRRPAPSANTEYTNAYREKTPERLARLQPNSSPRAARNTPKAYCVP